MNAPLRAEHALHVTYRRGAGGATGRFLSGLARGELWGSRDADGRVIVPPVDHDPETGAASSGFVRVADSGVVRSWTWVADPRPDHGRDRPFAFALIQLDGADTALFHIVDVGDERDMVTGMRVRADWAQTRAGSILDIRAFVPADDSPPSSSRPLPTSAFPGQPPPEPLQVVCDMRVEYGYEPGVALSGFLRALGERRIEGGRCPSCAKVYVPPRVRCPACGTGPMTPVPVDDRGTIVSYTVVHVPVAGAPERGGLGPSGSGPWGPGSPREGTAPGSTVPPRASTEPPFAWAWIRLDGADVPFAHLLGDVSPDKIFVGQRIRAVWVTGDELAPTWESIRHFAPVAP